MIRDPLIVHQSDPGCLALLHAKASGLDDSGEAAMIGTATHAAAEDLTWACTLGGQINPMDYVSRAITRVAEAENMAPESVSEAFGIMERLIAKDPDLRFFSSEGAVCYPEWKWALDEHFAPVEPGDPTTAYEGTIDHLRVYEENGHLLIIDYKSIQKMPAGWELHEDWQGRVYSLAVLAHFPNQRFAKFRLVLLRHAYWIEEQFGRGDLWEASTRARMRYQRKQRLEAHASGDWPETLGTDCKWCPLIHKCGEMEKARKTGKVPALPDDELARRHVAVKSLAAQLARETVTRVDRSGPLPMGDGSVLGQKPVQKWTLTHGEGVTIEKLRKLGMTFDQETEWFAKGVAAAKAKDALRKMLGGKEFKAYIAEGSDPIVEPYTAFQHSVWRPEGDVK